MDYSVLREFVEDGSYLEMKDVEVKLELLKASIRAYQEHSNRKRIEWKEYGVVGKFIAFKKYSTDLHSIYEMLGNHGISHLVLKVNWTKLTTDEKKKLFKFIVPSPPHLRFVHVGIKHSTKIIPEEIEQMDISDRVREWKDLKCYFDQKIIQWNLIKRQTLFAMLRRKDNTANLPFGKINIIKPSPKISTINVYRECGEEVMRNVGSIDYKKLTQCVAKGFMSESEVNQFRKMIEIDLRYYLMEIHKEESSNQAIQNKRNHLSNLNRGI